MRERITALVSAGLGLFIAGGLMSCAPAEVAWASSYDDALSQAQEEDKMMLVWLTADWCIVCAQMEEEAWTDSGVRRQMAKYVNVQLDVDDRSERAKVEAFYAGGVPQLLIMDKDGRVMSSLSGYPGNQNLADALRRAERS